MTQDRIHELERELADIEARIKELLKTAHIEDQRELEQLEDRHEILNDELQDLLAQSGKAN